MDRINSVQISTRTLQIWYRSEKTNYRTSQILKLDKEITERSIE